MSELMDDAMDGLMKDKNGTGGETGRWREMTIDERIAARDALLLAAHDRIAKLELELVNTKASLFRERAAHEEIVGQWKGTVQEDEAIIEGMRDEIELLKQTLADNEAYGLSVITERDALRAALNHAVYMQDKVRAERDKAEDLAERLRKQVKADEEFHPRAMKLLRKRKPFLVVANDEPYFVDVYKTIRANELKAGRWTDEDERRYQNTLSVLAEYARPR